MLGKPDSLKLEQMVLLKPLKQSLMKSLYIYISPLHIEVKKRSQRESSVRQDVEARSLGLHTDIFPSD